MPDVPDIHQPVPDAGHEMLRQSVVAALDDLTTKATQMAGVLLLVETSFNFAQTFLDSVVPLQQALTALSGQVTDQAGQLAALTDRVAALETPLPPAA